MLLAGRVTLWFCAPESLHVFGETCGWPTNMPAPRENVNPARVHEGYALGRDEFEEIRFLNQADMQIYSEAVVRLDSLLDD